jgi:hypothetical protein
MIGDHLSISAGARHVPVNRGRSPIERNEIPDDKRGDGPGFRMARP